VTASHARHGSSHHGRPGRRGRGGRRRWILVGAAIALLTLLGTGGVLAAVRYLPALDDARALNVDLERLVSRATDAGLGLDRPGLTALKGDLAAARDRFDRLQNLMATDPVVALARALPPSHAAVTGADAIALAGSDFLDAADAGLALADRYVGLRERQTASTGGGAGEGQSLAGLVELMATGRTEIDRMVAALDRADADLARAPADLPGPLAQVRTSMQERLHRYAPALRTFAELDATLPAILGWDAPKRYLVLTQNPAELRPTGGYIGSFGTITFDKGRITERAFQDVFTLDLPWDYPFVKPPATLTRYLLGPKQPWQLADANWSPDFPTSAQEAVRLYRNEGGSGAIDGVLGINTYTIDELLAVTGPVSVPTYGVTVASGETTLKTLQNTRVATNATTNRKAFLSAFADRLLDAVLALPPARWSDLASHGDQFGAQHLFLAWFADSGAQASMEKLGLDGSVRADAGDFVYPVDSNVSPVSKLNAVTDRALDLDVRLDQYGNALNELTVRWTNRIDTPEARPFRELPTLEGLTTLGMYFRLFVPERSRVEAVSAGTTSPINVPADVEDASGRTVIANYFRIPPGSARLSYRWTSPYAADIGEDGVVTYQLTIQKQPGLRPGPLRLRIAIPAGSTLIDASPGLAVDRETVTADATFDRDIVVVVRYRPAATGG
jgi:hypothetical protein